MILQQRAGFMSTSHTCLDAWKDQVLWLESQRSAEELKVRLSEMPELTDIIDNQNSNEPELHLTLKEKARSVKKKNKFEKMGQVIRFAQNRGFEPELIHRYLNDVVS